MVRAILPASFDPPTLGHLDLIIRASRLFDELLIAIGKNRGKTPFLEITERKLLLWEICKELPKKPTILVFDGLKELPKKPTILVFDGLLADYCKAMQVDVIVRGLRAITDFEYELQMAHANRILNGNVDTMFLATETETSFVSSSLVREVFHHGGDVSKFVPSQVNDYLHNRAIHNFTKE